MSYNGSGTFQINTSGQPVVTGTSISSTVFNALTADLATGLSTAITKDGQTTTTARIPFALGINSTLVTDATNTTSGSIITAGGVGIAKALYVGTTANVAGAVTLGGVATFSAQPIFSSLTASSAVATDASKGLVSVTNTGTGNNVLATSPTLITPVLGTPSSGTLTNCTGLPASTGITGTLGTTNGGTGLSSFTANGVVYASSTSALTTGSALAFNGSKLGIGTTSFDAPLQIQAITGGTSMRFNGRASPNDGYSDIAFYNSANTTQHAGIGAANSGLFLATAVASPIIFYINNADVGRFGSSGEFIVVGSTAQKATGTTWSNPSDQRLKDNIRDYAKGTAELMQVRVREWEYNGKGGTTEGTKGLGVVADEVMTVLPDTVENYDAKLNADDEETTAIKKFDATEITWLLVKTVQEQQAIITTLTDRITALEARNG